MMKTIMTILGCFAGVLLFVLYLTASRSDTISRQITKTKHDIEQEDNTFHALESQWSTLNSPQHLEALAKKYTKLSDMKANQITTFQRFISDEERSSPIIPDSFVKKKSSPHDESDATVDTTELALSQLLERQK